MSALEEDIIIHEKVVDHEFPDFETSSHFKFKLDSGVPDEMLNYLCDSRITLLSGMELIYTFEDTSVDNVSIIDGLLTRVNNFLSSSKPSNAKTSVPEILNIFSSDFENRQMIP